MSRETSSSSTEIVIPYVTGDPSEWPAESDAVIAAPEHHKVMFENEYVRVLEVYLAPGQVEPPHHHQWKSILCVLEGDHLVDHSAVTGEIILDTREGGDPLPYLGTFWKEPEALHYAENPSGTQGIRLLRVELKTAQ